MYGAKITTHKVLTIDTEADTIQWEIGEPTCTIINLYGLEPRTRNIFTDNFAGKPLVQVLHEYLKKCLNKEK